MEKIRVFLGYGVLIVLLPVAVFGMSFPTNEYRAMGIEAIDCDGPITVLIIALPALAVYGVASAVFLSSFRSRRSLFFGLFCGLICLGLGWNIGTAVLEQSRNGQETVCGDGI
ncbi:hypothetical protein CQ062_19635 [Ochrobactrum sp. MYb68]|nr:hypothetical protein CQ062_19635 [Ochrobactrum sp. MYb68]